ncbi:MAG: repressor LexA [Planctomycetota bacterium]|nr:MAG: repressor LexA [Planctomycetota bacterium]
MSRPLTRRQWDALQAFDRHQREWSLSPTLEELGEALGVNRITAYGHVQALIQKGYLENLEPGASRGFHLTRRASALLQERSAGRSSSALQQAQGKRVIPPAAPHPASLPWLGRIAAGQPLEVIEDPQSISLQDLIPHFEGHYVLQVAGDSMEEDHIQDGDWVIVRREAIPQNGSIVVAILEDESCTLKRFYRKKGGGYRLEPANRKYAPLEVERLEIRGVVTGVIRSFR